MKKVDTNTIDWFKPGLSGAIVGAGLLAIIGFSWGGWKTGASVERIAASHAESAVTMALLPVCLERSRADPQAEQTLALMKDARSVQRSEIMLSTGWASMPGSNEPNRRLANACVESLAAAF